MHKVLHNRPTLESEEIQSVKRRLEKNELTIGNTVSEFEKKFSSYIGIPSAAVSSGTSALHLSLVLLGVNEGSEVIIPSYACLSVALPILYQRSTPVFADIDKDYNLSPGDLRKRLTRKTGAVIVPHLFGKAADIQEIRELCDEFNVPLIEDCAQSIGARYDGKKVGCFGDLSIFSFNSTKPITSIQGGMICSKNKDWVSEVKDLRFPETRDFEDNRVRYSYTMSDVNAAVGIIQLKKLNFFIKRRRVIASIYKNLTNVVHPTEDVRKKHTFFRYMIRVDKDPDKIIMSMKKRGVACTRMHYPPLHQRAIFSENDIKLKNTEELGATSLSLPIYPSLDEEEALYVSENLNEITMHGR